MNKNYLKKWLIVQIKPNSYDLANKNLQRQGFETFLPKMKTTIKKENQFINKDVIVFPGYMFVYGDLQNSYWTKINSTYGVSKLLVFNNKPSTIPNEFILVLKNRYDENINPINEEKLKKDDVVKFSNGPFVDVIARIENVDEKSRIWVLLDVMGQCRKVQVQQKSKIGFYKT